MEDYTALINELREFHIEVSYVEEDTAFTVVEKRKVSLTQQAANVIEVLLKDKEEMRQQNEKLEDSLNECLMYGAAF